MKELLKRRLNNKGLTLIELLAVIVILGIIAAIAIPSIGSILENSRLNGVKSDAINVLNAANIYYTDYPDTTDAVTVKQLKDNNYLEMIGKIPENSTVSISAPRALTTPENAEISFSGPKKVRFENATVEVITSDTTKGSEVGNTTHVIKPQETEGP